MALLVVVVRLRHQLRVLVLLAEHRFVIFFYFFVIFFMVFQLLQMLLFSLLCVLLVLVKLVLELALLDYNLFLYLFLQGPVFLSLFVFLFFSVGLVEGLLVFIFGGLFLLDEVDDVEDLLVGHHVRLLYRLRLILKFLLDLFDVSFELLLESSEPSGLELHQLLDVLEVASQSYRILLVDLV